MKRDKPPPRLEATMHAMNEDMTFIALCSAIKHNAKAEARGLTKAHGFQEAERIAEGWLKGTTDKMERVVFVSILAEVRHLEKEARK